MSDSTEPSHLDRATPAPAGARVATRRSVLLLDRAMSLIIRLGGIGIIVAVLGIFVFILWQILPLFRGAAVELASSGRAPPGARLMLVDEWSERPGFLGADGTLTFIDLVGDAPAESIDLAGRVGAQITAAHLRPTTGTIALGLEDGSFALADVNYRAEFDDGRRRVVPEVNVGAPIDLGGGRGRVLDVDYGDSGRDKVAAAIVEVEGKLEVRAVVLTQRRTLVGAGRIEVRGAFDATPLVGGTPKAVLASSKGDSFLVVTDEGEIDYFFAVDSGFELRQRFSPFEDQPDPRISMAEFIFGDVSLALVGVDGTNRVFSLFVPEGQSVRTWGRTKQFPPLPGPVSAYTKSTRTKAFLVVAGSLASLRFSTTESIRWQEELPFAPRLVAISGKNDRILFVDESSRLHVYALSDPHPEASWRAFFGRIWYEGADRPGFEWQSTGGTDDFEPKLSMVPLLIGTLKGTFYALLFAVPIAVSAAMYASQFAHWKVRAFVKPLMEVMASLPSVVLGFLAALWLAPIIETRVPSVLLMLLLIPSAGVVLGLLWSAAPVAVRNRAGLFGELTVLLCGLLVAGALGWIGGPLLERLVFTVPDPAEPGRRIADFRLWWPAFTGADFQQRNSLVVGFMMGFAVIPIIFTIAEDALSNVPQSLRSGSLALGASRWQTAVRIVLPTASAGIFSALMIGLGRAVGETMIVLMATGNTPIMDFNIFSGMRTLSANIAVELPEAPHHGTLYRALFLGAMLLFLMTFAVNTVAEVLRQHLRERFRTI
ncbi:MAG TPA: ABC transporter permease subunit [Phycisphaerales bacterium]|nr:ABC transporter permease subunit [Phycisphaerales bacterium]HMP35922.1 ABC transporter permease subunit [Phycisphaerales bacterium]